MRAKKYKKALWVTMPVVKPKAKPIRRRTAGRAKEEAQYRKRVREIFSIKQPCRMPMCSERATEIHHTHGRMGKLLNYEPLWALLCKDCHRFVHEHPNAARTLGLMCEKGLWNSQEVVK